MDGSGASWNSTRLKALLDGPTALRARRLFRNRIFLFGVGPAILIAIGVIYFVLNAGAVSTDDATVSAARVAISPTVRGRIVAVMVHDNQVVNAGDVLVRLDDSDYQTAVANAQAHLAAARLQVAALRTQYSEAIAQSSAAQTTRDYAQREVTRERNLFRAGVVSRQDVDNAQHQADLAARQSSVAVESQATALANLGGSVRQSPDQHPLVMQAQAALDQAQSDLADTVIHAPRSGIVARVDQIQIGSYAQPAQALFWLISGQPWVDAAFKEDQLEHLQPGQPVLIHIDAYPHDTFRGHVASLSPGTGSSFSVLPTQNSSGNWVKVVQRLNVRIAFDSIPHDAALAVGLSANVRIDTAHRASPPLRGRED
jgi:membrane fusion protein (multidrug efflux system)